MKAFISYNHDQDNPSYHYNHDQDNSSYHYNHDQDNPSYHYNHDASSLRLTTVSLIIRIYDLRVYILPLLTLRSLLYRKL
jgi:uncharacterized membrane protein YkgB